MSHWIEETHLVSRKVTKHRFRKSIISAWDSRCYVCGEKFDFITLDHLIPKKCGGLTTKYNLAPCCSIHNRQKGHQELWSWWTRHECWDIERAVKLIGYLREVYLDDLHARPWDSFAEVELPEQCNGLPFLRVPDYDSTPFTLEEFNAIDDDLSHLRNIA